MTDFSDADLRAVLAVLVSRAGGTVEISRTEVYDGPTDLDIESTGQGVRVTVRPQSTIAAAARDVALRPRSNPLLDSLRSDELRLRVAPGSRKRAVMLIEALIAAAAERGHGFRLPEPDSAGFCVVVGQWSYRLVLEEQHPRIEWLPDVNDRRARQRIRSELTPRPSGRLVLSMPDDSGRYGGRRGRWEDREPSPLDDELVAVLSEIEARAELDEQRVRST